MIVQIQRKYLICPLNRHKIISQQAQLRPIKMLLQTCSLSNICEVTQFDGMEFIRAVHQSYSYC